MLSGGLAEEVATVPATAVSWLLYSVHAADDVILRAPACRGPKNLLFLLGMVNPKKQILRGACPELAEGLRATPSWVYTGMLKMP